MSFKGSLVVKLNIALVGKGCSKKQKSYCNDRNRFLIDSKGCWLRTRI